MYLLLTVLAVQQPAPPPASPVSDTAHVVIVATTDVHGRVLGWDYVRDAAAPGGLSRAATMVETLRAQYPEQVVLVDAGRSEEHTSELQSRFDLVCRLLLEKKKE